MTIDPVDAFIGAAQACVGAQEVPAGSNRGMFVELCQATTGGQPGDPWCADFMARVGKAMFGASWPLPLTGGCQTLYDWSLAHNLIALTPTRGDLFLVWEPSLHRFGHVGVVLTPEGDTISGNTTRPGAAGDPREGWVVARKPWTFKKDDRFVRWSPV